MEPVEVTAVSACPSCGASRVPELPGAFRGVCPGCVMREALAAPEPRQVGDFVLLDEVGRGGTGVVYRARQKGLDRIVAVKLVSLGAATALRREARAASQLRHPNIVAIHEAGRDYIAMDYIAGGPLAGPIPPARAASLVSRVARAVHHAHGMNIVHLDLKPSNILVDTEGEPHVVDFGLAHELGVSASAALLGTRSFMSPEQALGQPLTGRTDVYGLGGVLYAYLTGRPPFAGRTNADVLRRAIGIEAEPTWPEGALGAICMKALDMDPARRYATAAEMADDLDRSQRGERVRAERAGATRRGWVIWVVAAAMAIAGIVLLAVRR